jgi:hypothetical protein
MPGGHADCNWERSAVFSARDRKSSEGTRALAAYFCSTKALRRSADNPEEVPSSEPNALLNITRFLQGPVAGDGAEEHLYHPQLHAYCDVLFELEARLRSSAFHRRPTMR